MGIQKKPEVSYNKMNRTALILFAFFGLTMALSTKVHQKAKMNKSDRWESWGDSCPSNWVGDGAWDCECLDPNSEDFGAEGDEDEEEDPCTFWYVGDDYCDDECNVENHDFDGGDCCGDDVETSFCIECACL